MLITYHGIASAIVDSTAFCDRSEVTRSDEDGTFIIPSSRARRTISVLAYKVGYAYPHPGLINDEKRREVYLASQASYQARIAHLQALRGAAGCESSGEQAKRVASLLEGAIAELRQIARTNDDRKLLESLKAGRDIHLGVFPRGRS